MNDDRIKGQWKQLAGKLKAKWGKLTDDDLKVAEGNSEYGCEEGLHGHHHGSRRRGEGGLGPGLDGEADAGCHDAQVGHGAPGSGSRGDCDPVNAGRCDDTADHRRDDDAHGGHAQGVLPGGPLAQSGDVDGEAGRAGQGESGPDG